MLGAWVLLLVALSPGLFRVEIETTVDSILDRSAPEWATYQEAKTLFGGDEIVVVMLRDDTPFSRGLLSRVAELSAALEVIPGVRRVDSLTTVSAVISTAGSSTAFEPLVDADNLSLRSAGELAALVRDDPFASSNLASASGRSVAINLWLEDGAHEQLAAIMGEIATAVEGHGAAISGVPVFRWETNRRTQRELVSLVPLTVLALAIVASIVFRAWRVVAIPLLASGAATWVVLGAMGLFGVPLTVSTLILPTVLLALGVAYSSHLLFAAAREDVEEARVAALLETALPVALSGLTTSVGFVAISLVQIEAIQQIGGFGALGSLVCTLLALTAVPASLRLLRGPVPLSGLVRELESRGVDALLRVVSNSGPAVLAVSAGIGVVALVGALKLHVESDVVLWFPADDPIRLDYDQIGVEFAGISPMNVLIRGEPGALSSPSAIRAIGDLSRYLRELPDVGKVVSVADPLEKISDALSGGSSEGLSDEAEVEQYLLVLDGDRRMADLISSDRSASNVLLRADNNGSQRLLEIAERAERRWEEVGYPGTSAVVTGVMFEFARAEDAIARGQILGLGFAGLTIAILLWVSFGSARLALLALVPNALPIVVSFGVLGWIGLPLDAGTVLVGNLALGIAVDDTVHLIAGVSSRRTSGAEWDQAVAASMRWVAAPIVFTTLALSIGFAVLGASGFLFIRNLGLLTAGVLVLCLVADMLLLPTLLRVFRVGGGGSSG